MRAVIGWILLLCALIPEAALFVGYSLVMSNPSDIGAGIFGYGLVVVGLLIAIPWTGTLGVVGLDMIFKKPKY